MLTLYIVADCHKPTPVRSQLHESVYLWLHVGQVSAGPSARLSSLLLLLLKLEPGADEDDDDDDDSAFLDATHWHLIGFSGKSGKPIALIHVRSVHRAWTD